MIWHSESPTAILEQLKTDATTGLTTFQASEKLHKYGKNKLDEAPPKTFFQRFLDQMKDTMIIILLIAALARTFLNRPGVQAALSGIRPTVVGLVLATGVTMLLTTLFSFSSLKDGFAPDFRAILIFVILLAIRLVLPRLKVKKVSPIFLIVISAFLGILFYGILGG